MTKEEILIAVKKADNCVWVKLKEGINLCSDLEYSDILDAFICKSDNTKFYLKDYGNIWSTDIGDLN